MIGMIIIGDAPWCWCLSEIIHTYADDGFSACEGVSDLVLYKTKNDPSESISVLIADYTLEELLAVESNDTLEIEKSATFYYRTYLDESLPSSLFCNDIPDEVTITSSENDPCTANILTVLTKDDNDGILAELEDTETIEK